MTGILDRLTDAMGAAASTVRDDELRPLATQQRPAGRRWRQPAWAAPVAAAAAVALVIGLAVSVPNGLFGTRRHAGQARLPAAPRQFSPLIQNVSFGWLPAGESLSQGGVRPTEAYLSAGLAPAGGWELNVYARGRCRLSATVLTCGRGPNGSAVQLSGHAPAVRGHRALWGGPGPNLVWQYARGGWAMLAIPLASLSVLRHDPHVQHQAIKIAGHLRFGASTPALLFPAQLTGLTGQWRITDLHYRAASGVPGADSYTLITRTSRFLPHVGDLGVWANAAYVEVHRAPAGSTCTPHDPAYQNTSETIHGYRVVVQRRTAGGLLQRDVCAAHADGLWVYIEEFGSRPGIGVTSLFEHLRLLGTNPANWTHNPLG